MYSLSLQLKNSCSRWRTGFSKPQKLLAKQTVVLFDVCLGTFSANVSGVYIKSLQMKRDIYKGRSQHQRRKFTNFNTSKLKLQVHRHSLLPVKRRLGVATPPTGWRHPDGVMAVCRDDLWKYGRCFSAQEMERCLGSWLLKITCLVDPFFFSQG